MRTAARVIVALFLTGVVSPRLFGVERLYTVVLFNRPESVGASSMKSGLFFTTNQGDSWEHTGWKNVRAFGMAADGDRLLLAAGNGIHRSTDRGATWKIVTDWRVTEALRVVVDRDHTTIIAATAHGVWRSRDTGETWEEANAGLRSTFANALSIDTTAGRVLVGTEEALYISTDSGSRWMRAEDSIVCGTGLLNIHRCPADPRTLYLATENRGVLRSRDGGLHWTLAANGLLRTAYYVVTSDPRDARTVYAAGLESGVFKSTDGGDHWRPIGVDSLRGKDMHGLAVLHSAPNVVFAGEYNGGVWRSTDAGETWRKIGLDGSQVWEMTSVP